MIENESGAANEEQYVDAKYVREHLKLSRTKAYEIMKEIEGTQAPGEVIRIGRCLRVRKNAYLRWVYEQAS